MKFLHILCFIILIISPFIFAEEQQAQESDFPSNLEEIVDVEALEQFEKEIQDQNAIGLVFFYADWCGACKKHWPVFVDVARSFTYPNPLFYAPSTRKIRFGAMNADENQKALETKEGFVLGGYPTLYFYEANEKPLMWNDTSSSGMTILMKRKAQAPYRFIPRVPDDEMFALDEYVIMGTFLHSEDPLLHAFQKVALKLKDIATFVYTWRDPADGEVNPPGSVVLYLPPGSDQDTLFSWDQSITPELFTLKLEDKVHRWRYPMFNEISQENYRHLIDSERPIIWIFVRNQADRAKVREDLYLSILNNYQKKFLFVFLDWEKMKDQAYKFGVDPESQKLFPFVVYEDTKHKLKYTWDSRHLADFSFVRWIGKIESGDLSPTWISEPIPDPQTKNGLTHVVGKTFEEVVLKSDKDVLLEIYSATCPHCIGFQPTYEKIAQDLTETNPNLIVAQVDGQKNDIDQFLEQSVGMYPTVLFFPAHDKSQVLTYTGDREYDLIVDYVDQHKSMTINSSQQQGKTDEL